MKKNYTAILAIDSSDTPLRIAALCDGGRIRSASSAQLKQENHVVALANRLLAKDGKKLSDVNRVFVLRGPGRFTGIRIGLTVASVLGELNGAEMAAATVLETLAAQTAKTTGFANWKAKNASGLLAAITYAFREEFFCQIFKTGKDGSLSAEQEPRWLSSEELKKYLAALKKPVYCAGWGAQRAALAPWLPENCAAAPGSEKGILPATLVEMAIAAKPLKSAPAPLYLKPARYELEAARKKAAAKKNAR
jgi:tRNA threonylcarbamoyl adenosine modification protein YeaZ